MREVKVRSKACPECGSPTCVRVSGFETSVICSNLSCGFFFHSDSRLKVEKL